MSEWWLTPISCPKGIIVYIIYKRKTIVCYRTRTGFSRLQSHGIFQIFTENKKRAHLTDLFFIVITPKYSNRFVFETNVFWNWSMKVVFRTGQKEKLNADVKLWKRTRAASAYVEFSAEPNEYSVQWAQSRTQHSTTRQHLLSVLLSAILTVVIQRAPEHCRVIRFYVSALENEVCLCGIKRFHGSFGQLALTEFALLGCPSAGLSLTVVDGERLRWQFTIWSPS